MSSLTVAWSSRSLLFPNYDSNRIGGAQGIGIMTGIPPAEEHQLMFDVTVTDAARIVLYRTFPSKSDVRNDRGEILVKPCAYIV